MIAILLCTYNGEQYLADQIESLLTQTYRKFIVYIHDDGSTDDTLKIIERYTAQYPKLFVFVQDKESHRGAGNSFMWLLNRINSDYYMFCDQDDVWLPEKVELTYKKIRIEEQQHPDSPILIHTDLKLTDKYLNVTSQSFWRFQNFKENISKLKQYIGFGNIVTGCTVMINQRAKEVAFPYNKKYLHDYWLAIQVAKYGFIENINKQTVLYRQHGNNEAGAGIKYNKKQISFRNFFIGLKEEQERCKYICGTNALHWFWYRLLYFFSRHIG